MTYAIPQRYGGISREPADPPMEPVEREPTPADCYEDCIHNAACAMQYERWVEQVDSDNHFGWVDWLAERMGCGEDCKCCEFKREGQ